MKWQAKYTETDYEQGTTRLKRVFAWLPTYVNGTMVWLETYEVLQAYIIVEYAARIDDKAVGFKKGSWVDLSKRMIE